MRASLRWLLCWVFSISVERVATLVLTSPTWRTTYFFGAQPVDTSTATNSGTTDLIQHLHRSNWDTTGHAMQDPNLNARHRPLGAAARDGRHIAGSMRFSRRR